MCVRANASVSQWQSICHEGHVYVHRDREDHEQKRCWQPGSPHTICQVPGLGARLNGGGRVWLPGFEWREAGHGCHSGLFGQLRIDRTVEHGVGKAVQMIPSVSRSALRHVAHI